jgi:hypothetical protein
MTEREKQALEWRTWRLSKIEDAADDYYTDLVAYYIRRGQCSFDAETHHPNIPDAVAKKIADRMRVGAEHGYNKRFTEGQYPES